MESTRPSVARCALYILMVALVCVPGVALGEIVVVVFYGTVTLVEDPFEQLDDSIVVGAPLWGSYAFDRDDAVDPGGIGFRAIYDFDTTMHAKVGDTEFVTPDYRVFIDNDGPQGDLYWATSCFFEQDGVEIADMGVFMRDASETIFDSNDFPETIDPADFSDDHLYELGGTEHSITILAPLDHVSFVTAETFAGCLSGPDTTPDSGDCADLDFAGADIDRDGDVDLQDFAMFIELAAR